MLVKLLAAIKRFSVNIKVWKRVSIIVLVTVSGVGCDQSTELLVVRFYWLYCST
ncbi:MAG: hypothetical protein ACJAT7_000363 [Psychromonas sp.]|jgi:hypothetical protein